MTDLQILNDEAIELEVEGTASLISAVEWGNITGTLSNQEDLQEALDSKVNADDLSAVATSGDYDDLSNKPTIPDDNNLVHKTGNETISGSKTFSKIITTVGLEIHNEGDTGLNINGADYLGTGIFIDNELGMCMLNFPSIEEGEDTIACLSDLPSPAVAGGDYGTVKIKGGNGIGVSSSSGTLYIGKAGTAQISAKTNEYNPIVPANLDYAVKEGLANNKLSWTDTEKASARKTIGLEALDEINFEAGNITVNEDFGFIRGAFIEAANDGYFKIGSTTINEEQLKKLLELIQ